jgi:hypothetical protein
MGPPVPPPPPRHPPSPLPPLPPTENGNVEEKKVAEHDASPMKAAADLIQSLDIAYSEMTNFAADAARDAEIARRNARAASEIARRYLHRSYPKVQTPFGLCPSTPQRSKLESKVEDPLQAINGIASALQTPKEEHKYSFEPTPRQNRRTYNTPMSSERIAQSHAEDVLGLTIELERFRQALKSEQRMHEDTKASLASYKSKHACLEEQNHKLLEELERTKLEAQNRTSELEQELQKASTRVQAAEEDAQLALELAKDSAEKNDELEDWLQTATEEIRILNEEKAAQASKKLETPKRAVHFADTTPPLPPPQQPEQTPMATPASSTPRGGPSREMVAAGRQLLRRTMGSPGDEVLTLELTPAKSAERRRRLRERLTQQQDVDIPTPQKSPQRSDARISNKIVDECKNSAKLLQQSGQRLDLGGHWWRDQRGQHEINLEAMTRQYCQSVEVSDDDARTIPETAIESKNTINSLLSPLRLQFSIERQRKDIDELESLCGYLEKKIVTGS